MKSFHLEDDSGFKGGDSQIAGGGTQGVSQRVERVRLERGYCGRLGLP